MGTASKSPDSAVEVEELVIDYGAVRAVDHVSFSARQGEVTVLLGPNGAGKTSTVEHLEGYIAPSAGRSRVLGLDPLRDRRSLSRRVGLMLQQGGIPMPIRPTELLRQYADFFDNPMDPDELLDMVDLRSQAKTTYRRLSGGQRQRLSLAIALIGRPEVAFLDEPSAGVDLAGRDLISDVITRLRDTGACVVVTTHDLTEAERLADRVIIMDKGRVAADGALDELLSSDAAEFLLFNAEPGLNLDGLSEALDAPVAELMTGEYRLDRSGDPVTLVELTRWFADRDLQLFEIRAGRRRLDEVFRHLTGMDLRGDTGHRAAQSGGGHAGHEVRP